MSVRIDRLVLELPGLNPDQARGVAEGIGRALASLDGEAALDRISILLPSGAGADGVASAVVASVRARLG